MASYHSLCGLIFGQGIKEDLDTAMSFEKAISALSIEMSNSTKTEIN